jgi:hypothetical protein
MVFFQLVGTLVEFMTTQFVQAQLGFAGLVMLTLVLVGVRAGHARLAGWSAVIFLLLTLQA